MAHTLRICVLRLWHEEHLGAGFFNGNGFFLDAANLADVALRVDRACGGDFVTSSQLAIRERVEDGEGKCEAGGRPANRARIHRYRKGEHRFYARRRPGPYRRGR